jgi:short-subunit dehydrogenase
MRVIKGRNALVTGASRGIGTYITRRLAREGVNLAIASRDMESLEREAYALSIFGVRVKPYYLDLRDISALDHSARQIDAEMGNIDILINNAGVEYPGRLDLIDPEKLVETITTNVLGTILLTKAFLGNMLKRNFGHIVIMSSLAGIKGLPGNTIYSASKWGLLGFADGLRQELRGTNVSVSAVCPTFVSRAGVFARRNLQLSGMLRATTPEHVAESVVRCIKHDVPRIIVADPITKIIGLLVAVSPRLASILSSDLNKLYLS